MTTRLRVVLKRGAGADEKVLTAEHSDPCLPGPSIGPFAICEGSVYFYPGGQHIGEPIHIGAGQSIVITCEID